MDRDDAPLRRRSGADRRRPVLVGWDLPRQRRPSLAASPPWPSRRRPRSHRGPCSPPTTATQTTTDDITGCLGGGDRSGHIDHGGGAGLELRHRLHRAEGPRHEPERRRRAGTVRFTVNSPGFTAQVAPVDGTGWAEVTVSGVPAGNWTLTAEFQPTAGSVFGASLDDGSRCWSCAGRRRCASPRRHPVAVGSALAASFSVTDLTGTAAHALRHGHRVRRRRHLLRTGQHGQCSLTLASGGSFDAHRHRTAATSPTTRRRPTRLGDDAGRHVEAHGVDDDVVVAHRRPDQHHVAAAGPIERRGGRVTPFGEVCRSARARRRLVHDHVALRAAQPDDPGRRHLRRGPVVVGGVGHRQPTRPGLLPRAHGGPPRRGRHDHAADGQLQRQRRLRRRHALQRHGPGRPRRT